MCAFPAATYRYCALDCKDDGTYACVVVALLLLLHFRRLGETLLALTALAVGGVWLCGLLVLFEIPINPANLVAFPQATHLSGDWPLVP